MQKLNVGMQKKVAIMYWKIYKKYLAYYIEIYILILVLKYASV